MTPDRPALHQETEPEAGLHRRTGDLVYLAGLVLCCFLVAWLEVRGHKGDTVAYYDLSNAIRQHNWAACFNASWSPLYPALLTAGRALFHFNPRYTAAAGRLVNFSLALGLFASSYFLALSVRRYVVSRSKDLGAVLSHRTLMIWVTSFTFFLWANDMIGQKPDTLLTALLLLTTGLLIQGLTYPRWWPFLLAGLTSGLAYWTKSFAFPFIGVLLLFLMISQYRNWRALLQLAVTGVVFLLVAVPYISHISAVKHRFTIGDAGRLNSAWYVNGASRQDPVDDRTLDDFGAAKGNYLHPAQVIGTLPEIAYFPPRESIRRRTRLGRLLVLVGRPGIPFYSQPDNP